MRRCTRTHRSERGITVILFAIALTGLLAVGALVLGGSIGYTAARNAQTAADAAALAGSTALREHKANWVAADGGMSADDVLAEVESIVADNGAELQSCDLVNASYAVTQDEADVIDACDQLEFLTQEEFKDVAGVRVAVTDQRDVPFAAFVDQDTITASASAAATAQPVGRMQAPFLLCSTFDSALGVQPLVVDNTVTPPEYEVDPEAIGDQYVLWGTAVKDGGRDCGMSASAWRGLAATSFSGSVGGWWKTDTGNKTGQLSSRTNGVGDCEFTDDTRNLNGTAQGLIGCTVPVPLCVEGRGDNAAGWEMRCEAVVLFEITHVKGSSTTSSTLCDPGGAQNIVCGKLLGAAVASHGRGVADRPDGQVVVIKLVQ